MLKTLGALLVSAVMFATGSAAAQTTYSYTGNVYNQITPFTDCTAGGCANHTTSMRPVGTFQTAAPLAGGLSQADVTAQVTAYAFDDGLVRYESTDSQARLYRLLVSTDANGNLTQLSTLLQRWRANPYVTICEAHVCATPTTYPVIGHADPANKFDEFTIRFTNTTVVSHNRSCVRRDVSPSGTPEVCEAYSNTSDPNLSTASAPNAPYPVVVAVAVPTMTEWAMILFGLILAGGAALTIQRRRMT